MIQTIDILLTKVTCNHHFCNTLVFKYFWYIQGETNIY